MLDLSKGYIPITLSEFDGTTPIEVRYYIADNIDYYETLLGLAIIMRARKFDDTINPDNQANIFPKIERILTWLRSTDFYTTPASTKYHDSYDGGLLRHTLLVYNELVALRNVPKFSSVVENSWYSAVFAAMVHDWCKIGRYEKYQKNVKDANTGEWGTEDAYRYTDNNTSPGSLGHGTQSLAMVMQLCNTRYTSLTFEEMAAIRWHMGSWDLSSYDLADFRVCANKLPLVHMIQFADQLATAEY